MTTVSLAQDRHRYRVACEGHADSAEMCAAISCLLYSLAGWISKSDRCAVERCRLEEGDAELQFRGGLECQTAFELALVGFAQLAETDPAGVTLDADFIDG